LSSVGLTSGVKRAPRLDLRQDICVHLVQNLIVGLKFFIPFECGHLAHNKRKKVVFLFRFLPCLLAAKKVLGKRDREHEQGQSIGERGWRGWILWGYKLQLKFENRPRRIPQD
jgi:hypothetical protein